MRAIDQRKPGLCLGLHHFAFFRGHLDGIPLEHLGDLYLETGDDLKHASRTLSWIRSELVAAAKRYVSETGVTQASLSRLMRIEPDKLTGEERLDLSEMPSLEDFRAEFDPTGFYNEAELIQEFAAKYSSSVPEGALRKSERNARLRARLRRTIGILENWLATTPKPTDPISIWFHPMIATRLSVPETGILTIGDLVHWINTRGHIWYRRIPSIGALKARRIIAWLQINKVLPLNEFALVPYRTVKHRLPSMRPSEFGIVPMEHLKIASDLDGSEGLNRSHKNPEGWDSDRAAIESWLYVKAGNPNTQRSYRSQAERFLLWMLLERKKPLSSATTHDCAAYKVFLDDLGDNKQPWSWTVPRSAWIGDKTAKRWHPDWRPFTGQLTLASRRQAVTVLKGLFGYLKKKLYLEYDPWSDVATPKRSGRRLNVNRIITPRQWEAVIDELEEMDLTEAYYRLRLALWLLYTSGLRLFELVGLTVKNLERRDGVYWELKVIGKNDKEREIPIADEILEMIKDYFEVRGLGRDLSRWEKNTPVFTTLSKSLQHAAPPGRNMADSSLYKMLTRHFDLAANRLYDLIDAQQLRKASTHWLRHTFATESLARGASQDTVQDLMGHSDPATTAIYVHALDDRKRAAVESLLKKRR